MLAADPWALMPGPVALRRRTKKSSKRVPKSKKTISMDLDDSKDSEDLCGKLCSQPTEDKVSKCRCRCTEKWGFRPARCPTCTVSRKESSQRNPPLHNFKDHSNYIRQLMCNNESRLCIAPIADLLIQYRKDSSSSG